MQNIIHNLQALNLSFISCVESDPHTYIYLSRSNTPSIEHDEGKEILTCEFVDSLAGERKKLETR